MIIIKNCFKFAISGFLSIVILSLFVNLYCNSGVHYQNMTGATDYTYQPLRLSTDYEEGFSCFHFDKSEFNNYYSIDPIEVLLMVFSGKHLK